MKKIKIKCPSCSKIGFIEINLNSIKNTLSGILAVNIAKDITCSHSYIAYIDKNLNIRDYFTTDFQIELPNISPEEISKVEKVPSEDIVDIDLIKLNISAPLLTNIFNAILLKQKIVLIFNQEFLHKHIYNFFKCVTQKSFEINITIITDEKYNDNKSNYKDSMVFKDYNIVRNEKNLINSTNLEIIGQMVHKFMTDLDSFYSYIILKNNIQKAYELSKTVKDYIISFKESKEFSSKQIFDALYKTHHIKVPELYLNFLIKIVEFYFEVKVNRIKESSDFLGLI